MRIRIQESKHLEFLNLSSAVVKPFGQMYTKEQISTHRSWLTSTNINLIVFVEIISLKIQNFCDKGDLGKMSKSGAKILVIDDDPDFKKVVSLMLESKSYNVVTAKNSKDAREKIFEEKPDLILLDIMMDSIFDGYSLCNEIKTSKEFQEFRETPIIFVSAVKDRAGSRVTFDTTEHGLVGPDDYMDKPVQQEDLIVRIEKLLKK